MCWWLVRGVSETSVRRSRRASCAHPLTSFLELLISSCSSTYELLTASDLRSDVLTVFDFPATLLNPTESETLR